MVWLCEILMYALQFDAVNLSHNVEAEYGNQGTDFFCVPREGFGTNGSIVPVNCSIN